MEPAKKIILAVTGATGMIYVLKFLELLRDKNIEIHGIISDAGRKVLRLEMNMEHQSLPGVSRWFDCHDFTAPMASGSCHYDSMVILPCTAGTLGSIASGISGNLIHRAADVSLKERRPFLLAVRETPFNKTHLKNMMSVHDAGGIICPPMPSFYSKPQNIDEMARNFSGRICDQLGITVEGVKRWKGVDHDF